MCVYISAVYDLWALYALSLREPIEKAPLYPFPDPCY
jgi:hypothetical protein